MSAHYTGRWSVLVGSLLPMRLAFDYQVTITPTVDPSQVNTRVSSLARGFDVPAGITVDSGMLYVADTGNHVIKLVDAKGLVRTVAGSGIEGFMDGSGSEAAFFNPHALAVSPDGNVYIADSSNHAIRRMSTGGYVVDTLWAGKSSAQAERISVAGNVTGLWSPMGIAVWDTGPTLALLVADTDNHRIVRLTPPAGGGTPWELSLFAGTGARGFEDGSAHSASFRYPRGLAVCTLDSQPVVLVADTSNHVIRRIQAQANPPGGEDGWGKHAAVSTMAGDGSPGSEDSHTKREKPKASILYTTVLPARFSLPQDVACDGHDGAVVADTNNQAVRHVSSDGITLTLGGGKARGYGDGSGSEALFAEPAGIAYDTRDANVFVIERGNRWVRKLRSMDGGAFSFTRGTTTSTSMATPRLSSTVAYITFLAVVAGVVLTLK